MTDRSPARIRAARIIAIAADAAQLVFFPIFVGGFSSPADDALDVAVGVVLTWLIGWHNSFLPSFIIEALPIGDLVPSWTLAVFMATRKKSDDAKRSGQISDGASSAKRIN